MKKLFVAVLAIAALAACNKEEAPVYQESVKKSIAITIANGVADTKAVAEETPEAVGGEATIVPQENNQAAASTDELVVLFANRAGVVVEAYSFADAAETTAADPNADPDVKGVYTYTFHAVHESVEQVAVVRYAANTTPEAFENTNLSVYAEAAAVEDLNVDLDELELYASADLEDSGKECEVQTTEHVFETYKLYTAALTVTPALARVEIVGVNCTDLGVRTLAAVSDATIVGGYDELALTDVVFGETGKVDADGKYTGIIYNYDFLEADVLKGVYAGERNTTAREAVVYDLKDTKDAIAWNIAPQAAPTAANPMIFTMEAKAYDYTVLNTTKTLTIESFEGVTNFDRSKIYRLDLEFVEDNLDATNEAICVKVDVTIANWVVVELEPNFKTN